MIDPILSLAFSVHSNKGIFALLLGSGLSRSAGIPTGWEIVIDLIRKIAHIRGEDCEPDPAAWYKTAFGENPDYAKLLDNLARSPSERSGLLKNYFEPSDEERGEGLKIPTDAHKAIAGLVKRGHIRVIVTTNFDRLLENALEEQGITPTVISSPDATEGALPLPHLQCLIIKLHGDYLDTRIKNTPSELGKYDKRIKTLLNRIFDEYGLIVSGWSAEWDIALCSAIKRCKNHRFTTYWTTRHGPGDVAKKLIRLRRAELIEVKDADSFFIELLEKVNALEDFERPHPLSAKAAVAVIKNYLVDKRHTIRLHDMLNQETEKVYNELSEKHFPVNNVPFSPEELLNRANRYEALTEILRASIITGCYWGEKEHEDLWKKCLERVANSNDSGNGLIAWIKLRYYPALLLLYAGGIAAIAAKRYSTLWALLNKTKIHTRSGDRPLIFRIYTDKVMGQKVAQELPGKENLYTPLSDHLFDRLRDDFRDIVPDDAHYDQIFNRFEYLKALTFADMNEEAGAKRIWGPIGRFGWNRKIQKIIEDEMSQPEPPSWPPLEAGFFGGSLERAKEIKRKYDELINRLNWD